MHFPTSPLSPASLPTPPRITATNKYLSHNSELCIPLQTTPRDVLSPDSLAPHGPITAPRKIYAPSGLNRSKGPFSKRKPTFMSSPPLTLASLSLFSERGPTHAKTYSSSSPLLMPPLQRRPCLRLQFRGSDEIRPYLIGDWSGPLLGQILPFLKFISLRLRCTLTKIACYIN